jgi:tetratricopeptide (TPR) repeat protein
LVLLAAGLIGLPLLLQRRFAVGLTLAGIAIFSTAVLIAVVDFDNDFENAYANRLFFVPAYMALGLGGAFALAAMRAVRTPDLRASARIAAWTASAALVFLPLRANWAECDYSSYRIVAEFGRRMIESVALDAVIFPTSDHHTFPLLYLKYVEGRRPDVTLGDKYGYADQDLWKDVPFAQGIDAKTARSAGYKRRVEAWLLATTRRPVYFTRKHALPAEGRTLESEGMYERAWRDDDDRAFRKAAADAAWGAVEAFPLNEQVRPYDFTARMILGDVCFADARRRFAVEDVEGGTRRAVEGAAHVPLSKEIQNNHASLLAEHGRVAEAEPLFRRAMALDPNYKLPRRNLATALRFAGRTEEAVAAWTEIFLDDPQDVGAVIALGEMARKDCRWDAAADYLERGGDLTGDPRMFRDAGLICLLEIKKLDKAKHLLERSLRINPNQPDIRDVAERIVAKKDPREAAMDAAKKPEDGETAANWADPKKAAGGKNAASLKPSVPDPRAMARPELPARPSPYGLPSATDLPKNGLPSFDAAVPNAPKAPTAPAPRPPR